MEKSGNLGIAYRAIEEYKSRIEERKKLRADLEAEDLQDREALAQIISKAEELNKII